MGVLQQREPDSPDASSDDPNLAELHRLARRFLLMLVHTGMPCTVVGVTPPNVQTGMPALVDVQPSIMAIYYSGDGTEMPMAYPIARACPIMMVNSGGFAIRVLPRVGDFGYVHACERSLEAWYRGAGVPTPPSFMHCFSLSDGVFYPGVRPGPNPLPVTADLAIGTDTGAQPGAELGELVITPAGQVTLRSSVTVTVDAPTINVGLAAADQIVTASRLKAMLAALVGSGVVAPGDGGAAYKAALVSFVAALDPASIGSTKGRAE